MRAQVVILLVSIVIGMSPRVAIVIRDSPDSYSVSRAARLRSDIMEQTAAEMSSLDITVHLLHEVWPFHRGAWTILPVLGELLSIHEDTTIDWVFLCEENTEVSVRGLVNLLTRYNPEDMLFLGHALHDSEPSIIHHFAFINSPESFHYPDFEAGWAISGALLRHSVEKLRGGDQGTKFFTIDVQHEVAMFYHKQNITLTHVPEFCINKPLMSSHDDECVSTVQFSEPNCGIPVNSDDIVVFVKTCEKYHRTRIPVFNVTSAVNVKHIRYFSDVTDDTTPTLSIGIPNTVSGHCAKLSRMIEEFALSREWSGKKWLVIVDDDTIMNFTRLQQLLACHNHLDKLMLGERYGFGFGPHPSQGYSYPTGGSGMILSRPMVTAILDAGCRCPRADSPDDMWLGSCVENRVGVAMVPSKSLHQTYPSQYSGDMLSHRFLVSFHKHSHQDPLLIFRQYLGGGVRSMEEREVRGEERGSVSSEEGRSGETREVRGEEGRGKMRVEEVWGEEEREVRSEERASERSEEGWGEERGSVRSEEGRGKVRGESIANNARVRVMDEKYEL